MWIAMTVQRPSQRRWCAWSLGNGNVLFHDWDAEYWTEVELFRIVQWFEDEDTGEA